MTNPYPSTALGLGAIKQAMIKANRVELNLNDILEQLQVEVEILDEEWHEHSFLYQLFHSEDLRFIITKHRERNLCLKTRDRFHDDYCRLRDLYEKKLEALRKEAEERTNNEQQH